MSAGVHATPETTKPGASTAGRQLKPDTRQFLVPFLAIAGIAIAIVLGFYCYAFAPGSWFTLSRNPDDWARFGEYVGGSLGAFFGLLAFGGVLLTIREQRRQGELEEMQRQMTAFSQRIETILSEEPAETDAATRQRITEVAKPLSVYSLLSTIGNQAIRGPDANYLVNERRRERRELVVPTIKRQLTVMQIELQHLIWCLDQHASMGGTPTLKELYVRKYSPVVCWMHVLDTLISEPVRDFFDPEAFCRALRDAPGEFAPEPTPSTDGHTGP